MHFDHGARASFSRATRGLVIELPVSAYLACPAGDQTSRHSPRLTLSSVHRAAAGKGDGKSAGDCSTCGAAMRSFSRTSTSFVGTVLRLVLLGPRQLGKGMARASV